MPRVVLALLRHGAYDQPSRTPSAHLPIGLNTTGREQANAAVATLVQKAAAEGWEIETVLDTSRLLRAWDTAVILARGFQTHLGRLFRVAEFDVLAERSVGSAANLTLDEIAASMGQDPRYDPPPPDWQRRANYRLPFLGAESLIQAGERVARFLEERASQLSTSATRDVLRVIVGHGGSFRFAAVRLGILNADEATSLSMHHCAPIFLERHDAFRWKHVGGAWKERAPATTSGD